MSVLKLPELQENSSRREKSVIWKLPEVVLPAALGSQHKMFSTSLTGLLHSSSKEALREKSALTGKGIGNRDSKAKSGCMKGEELARKASQLTFQLCCFHPCY